VSTKPNALAQVEAIIAKHCWIPPEERLAAALWTLHAHVYDRYTWTPRLAILSPVFGCGKTTLLEIIQHLTPEAQRYINISPASVYRVVTLGAARTLLFDEGNHQLRKLDLINVLNGCKYGDMITRCTVKEVHNFSAFAPIAIAAMGKLPRDDLMQRSIVINMTRQPPDAPIHRLNAKDLYFKLAMSKLLGEINEWAGQVELHPDPPSPVKVRYADNWRPLIAIADAFGVGDRAREIAIQMCSGLPDDDKQVQVLADLYDIFVEAGPDIDRIGSFKLTQHLHNRGYTEWTGLNGERQPHSITTWELAKILEPFKIRPQMFQFPGPKFLRDKNPGMRGYFRKDFEAAWASYLPRNPATPQPAALTAPVEGRVVPLAQPKRRRKKEGA